MHIWTFRSVWERAGPGKAIAVNLNIVSYTVLYGIPLRFCECGFGIYPATVSGCLSFNWAHL